jgi:hypothetical protein
VPDRDPVSDDIQELLRQPMPPEVEEFARIHLDDYRTEALAAARAALDRAARKALVAAARWKLRDKLRSLLTWAKDTGRMR